MIVNGEEFDTSALKEQTLTALLGFYNLSETRVAVEINGSIIKKKDIAATKIAQNDKIEIIHFVGGGN